MRANETRLPGCLADETLDVLRQDVRLQIHRVAVPERPDEDDPSDLTEPDERPAEDPPDRGAL